MASNSSPMNFWNFSQVFEEICNFIAVAKTGHPRDTLAGLLKICLLANEDGPVSDVDTLRNTIVSKFGVDISPVELQSVLNESEAKGLISRPTGTNYVLSTEARKEAQESVQKIQTLEKSVKAEWFEMLDSTCPKLSKDVAWKALRTYLSRTFRRHGVQAAALLDPTIQTPTNYERSLSSILDESIKDHFDGDSATDARKALSAFLAELGSNNNRMVYIGQLADSAFNFFSLQQPLSVSEQLRKGLSELTLFLAQVRQLRRKDGDSGQQRA